MKIKIKRIHPDAKIPTKATEGSAGYDIYSVEDMLIFPQDVVAVSTGLEMEIPQGYEVQIRPRSGLAFKNKITVINSPGTIDSDYRNEVKVLIYNTNLYGPFDLPKITIDHKTFKIKKGMRIAQMVVNKLPDVELEETLELSDTDRNGGFGSTGQ